MEFALEYKVKQRNSDKFPSHYNRSILKCKSPSVHKPRQKQAPQKGPLKNIRPGDHLRNFVMCNVCAVIPNVVLDLIVRLQIVKFISNKKTKATWKENSLLISSKHTRENSPFPTGH